jgi:hypothetical protein
MRMTTTRAPTNDEVATGALFGGAITSILFNIPGEPPGLVLAHDYRNLLRRLDVINLLR